MKKLYYEDIYQTDFTATVTECIPNEQQGTFDVILDQTAFFPEEGGQSADLGTLNGQEVLDVQIKEDVIYHTVSSAIPAGSVVDGHVDWAQRFDFMQQHSGEHMISGLIHTHFGLDNVGFHLSRKEVTLDMNGELSPKQLSWIEQEANTAIWKDLPVDISYPDPEKLQTMTYRSKLALTENVRIVTIPGIDICACCAPHVTHTGQIGLVKIAGVQSHRGGVRINILCGSRALSDYSEKQEAVSRISSLLSARQPAVADAVIRLQEEAKQQKNRVCELQAQLLSLQMQALPSPKELPNPLLFTDSLDSIALRNAVNELTARYPGYCGIFAGNEASGYRFVIGSSSRDCNELAMLLRQSLQAKCGGSAPMIQGSVTAAKEALLQIIQ